MIGLSAPIAGYKGQVSGKRRQRASQGIRDKDVGGSPRICANWTRTRAPDTINIIDGVGGGFSTCFQHDLRDCPQFIGVWVKAYSLFHVPREEELR